MKPPAPVANPLLEYVREHKRPGRRCAVCSSPHRALIEDAFAQGAGQTSISRGLRAKLGVDLPVGALYAHFQREHHKDGAR